MSSAQSSIAAFLRALTLSHPTPDIPDFDSGINASSAWTESLPLPAEGVLRSSQAIITPNINSLSDDEFEPNDDEAEDIQDIEQLTGRFARALYAFEGKPEFRELTDVHAGDELENTGEWLPSFRRSLLGGRSLNRFSNFVTSGAEAFVLQGNAEDVSPSASRHERMSTTASVREDVPVEVTSGGEADRHYVEAGPAWKPKVPPFRILVHSPSKRNSGLSGAYTIYSVTSMFDAPRTSDDTAEPEDEDEEEDSALDPPPAPVRITVHRRFSHFVVLHTALTRRLPGIALPPLPEKQYAGRFNADFVEARRCDLERYLSRVVRHPIARYAEVLTFFLGCDSDLEWKKQYPLYLELPPAGPVFFANVFHPAFNLDHEEATAVVDKFVAHTRSVGKGVQGLRSIFTNVREASIEMSKAQRLVSYSLLSLFTSKPLASAPTTGVDSDEEEDDRKLKGHMNDDRAWCWRDSCEDCLKLTKAMQKTTEVLQGVADLYDDHARRTQLVTHEALKSVAHPASLYAGVVETHRSTLSRYNEATLHGAENEEMAARCETVLNTTMAEIETYHTQKLEDFQGLTKGYLDDEIAFYEQVLSRLKVARRTFDAPQYDQLAQSPRQPSIYERELEQPRLNPPLLTQPCPHVFDSAPMRPVSVAIQEGVGMLIGSPTRASMFGKFCGESPDFVYLVDLEIIVANRAHVAAAALFVYDTLLTFPQEVNHVWGRQFSGTTLLYFVNRYCLLAQKVLIILEVFPWQSISARLHRGIMVERDPHCDHISGDFGAIFTFNLADIILLQVIAFGAVADFVTTLSVILISRFMLNLRDFYISDSEASGSSRTEFSSVRFTDVLVGTLGAPLVHGEPENDQEREGMRQRESVLQEFVQGSSSA
ncbi:hypothetical protein EUX98_g3299 [Antrodiella citrinella]|uniref:PX domain-containing protein n=1 Tax=Antrodiella citrinella TaxID=2447956 RepID=A0A4S4MY40_9APHY|nr:hypothetical protein EUX98_g3299 [Antrodiella citrinella]